MDLQELFPDAHAVDEAVLIALEARLGVPLPAAVRRVLAATGGGRPIPHRCTTPGAEDLVELDRLLEPDGHQPSARGVAGRAGDMAGRLPDGVLPVADAAGGNLLVVALAGGPAPEGAIGFWDHEQEEIDGEADPAAITWLADDLERFLAAVEPHVAVTDAGPPPGAVVVSVDPEQLARWRAAERGRVDGDGSSA